ARAERLSGSVFGDPRFPVESGRFESRPGRKGWAFAIAALRAGARAGDQRRADGRIQGSERQDHSLVIAGQKAYAQIRPPVAVRGGSWRRRRLPGWTLREGG